VARVLEACADQITPVPQALPSGQAEQDNGLYLGQAPMSPEQISALRQLYQKPTLRKLVDELVEDYLAEDTSGSSSGASSSGPAAANGQSASSAGPSQACPDPASLANSTHAKSQPLLQPGSSTGSSQASPASPDLAGMAKSTKFRPFPHPKLMPKSPAVPVPEMLFPQGPGGDLPADGDTAVWITLANWAKGEGKFHSIKTCFGLHEARTPCVQAWRRVAVQRGHTACVLCKP
jgi:hypothetical protein